MTAPVRQSRPLVRKAYAESVMFSAYLYETDSAVKHRRLMHMFLPDGCYVGRPLIEAVKAILRHELSLNRSESNATSQTMILWCWSTWIGERRRMKQKPGLRAVG